MIFLSAHQVNQNDYYNDKKLLFALQIITIIASNQQVNG